MQTKTYCAYIVYFHLLSNINKPTTSKRMARPASQENHLLSKRKTFCPITSALQHVTMKPNGLGSVESTSL